MTLHAKIGTTAAVLKALVEDSRRWVWGAVLISLVVVGSISWIYLEQVDAQQQAVLSLQTLRQARVDLAKGFLHVSLSGDPSSPFDRGEGMALLVQAVSEFAQAQSQLGAEGLREADTGASGADVEFTQAVLDFRLALADWISSGRREAARETQLRNTFYALEQQADMADAASQAALLERMDRLNRNFVVMVTIAAVLLLAVCCGLYFAGVARRKSEVALRESERHRAEQEQQLTQTRRLEAIGRLAGGVAHDLNNMLTPIMGYSEMLLGDLPEGDLRRGMASEIHRAASRSADLVAKLLAFGRRQSLEIGPVDLNEVVDDLMQLLERTIRENVSIDLQLSSDTPAIGADAAQVGQVVLNLAMNAQDAMPNGGTLMISTERVDVRPGDNEAPALAPGIYALLTVKDTGMGMDAETKARIFEPFFTTKALGEGTGLGLATVHGVVRQHKGDVAVETEPGVGTTFEVYLPAAGEKPGETLPVATLPGEAPAPGETSGIAQRDGHHIVLLAEGDPLIRGLATRVLARQGLTVIEASTAAEAEESLARTPDAVALLIADVALPGLRGPQLYARLIGKRPALRVVYLSEQPDELPVASDHPNGAVVVAKAFVAAQLGDRVREVLERPAGDRPVT